MRSILQKSVFVLRFHFIYKLAGYLRKAWFSFLGMEIGNGVLIPRIYVTWPHQVSFKNDCIIEHGIYFKYSSYWKKGPSICFGERVFIGSCCEFNISKSLQVGNDTNIASGCKFVDHDHGIKAGKLIGDQECTESSITIGNGVWLGFNAIILKGVKIGDGAVVAAGAVVTKSIPPDEIWAGVPARKVGIRE